MTVFVDIAVAAAAIAIGIIVGFMGGLLIAMAFFGGHALIRDHVLLLTASAFVGAVLTVAGAIDMRRGRSASGPALP